ncbi:hypothetical protein [Aestuariispira insulae]|uniref:Periplasmic heavy metal sensor n=1 Tax=Aestuariispira insulae TaxID=1461337 RepID=A0A3D9H5U6_9PROT|nr:hypothetical protein [Aestuariispira insulae]RED44854.1 hypothetical protein DFP90_11359 [Aestuariispira insulae]
MKPLSRILYCLAFLLTGSATVMANDQPYAGHQNRQIKSLSPHEIEGLKSGAGMGLAKAAELNHYPGPRHLLDAPEAMSLTAKQIDSLKELHSAMQKEASDIGHEIIRAEGKLNALFAEQTVQPDNLSQAILEIGQLWTRLRLVHLKTHLQTKDLLTEDQIDLYDRLRGYTPNKHDH